MISFIICAILILMPFSVRLAEDHLTKTSIQPIPANKSNESVTTNGVVYIGSVTSHEGSDLLCVTPAKIYVPNPGEEVTINVTIKFKHAQPCPYSDWKILTENAKNVKIVEETETKLVDPYTAVKQYKVKVLGNGTLDVVFKYGSNCPYGTEERVTVYFYVGAVSSTELNNTSSTSTPTLISNTSEKIISGIVEEVNAAGRYFVVNGTHVAVRGRWTTSDGLSYNWREMLTLIHAGERIKVKAVFEDGEWRAEEITINGKTFMKG